MNEKLTEMVFKDYYESLPMEEKLKLRDDFLSRTGLSIITFYQKLRTNNFRPLERELLNDLLNKGKY